MISSGQSNYPNDFDLFPTSGASTLIYVVDQERDPITGIILVSGTPTKGLQINSPYTIIQKIEQTLGKNPQGIYSTVDERITNLVAGLGVYVHSSGDSMFGNLSAGVSGTYNIGSASSPFNIIYANQFIGSGTGGGSGTGTITSVNDYTGPDVVLAASDVGAYPVTGGKINGFASVGTSNIVSGNSLAVGHSNHVQGVDTFGAGVGNNVQGQHGGAFGSYNTVLGVDAFSQGENNNSKGRASVTFGNGCTANGVYDFAAGYNCQTYGGVNVAMGGRCLASGNYNAVFNNGWAQGNQTFAANQGKAYGDNSSAFGQFSEARGAFSTALNLETKAWGDNSLSIGLSTVASGNQSLAGGDTSITRNYNGLAFGSFCEANGDTSIGLGRLAIADHTRSIVLASNDSIPTHSTAIEQITLGFANGVVLTSGTNLLPTVSGQSIGVSGNAFNGYFTSINDDVVVIAQSNIVASGICNGFNVTFVLPQTPYGLSLRVYDSTGKRFFQDAVVTPGDFSLSSATITMFTPPVSGLSIICDYNFI